jgi:hypothetical protein
MGIFLCLLVCARVCVYIYLYIYLSTAVEKILCSLKLNLKQNPKLERAQKKETKQWSYSVEHKIKDEADSYCYKLWFNGPTTFLKDNLLDKERKWLLLFFIATCLIGNSHCNLN